MKTLQKLAIRFLPEEWLFNFRWYRKHCGGFWVHSGVMGWEKRKSARTIAADINCASHCPELYSYGKDIEDYR